MKDSIVNCSNCGARNRIPAVKQHLKPNCGKCKQRLDLSGYRLPVVELTDGIFHGFVREATLPLMVDFYSPTCGPCLSMAPVIESLVNQYFGRVIIAKINTTANPAIATQFNIRGVPSFLFFRQGKLIDQVTGAVPGQMLSQKIDSLI